MKIREVGGSLLFLFCALISAFVFFSVAQASEGLIVRRNNVEIDAVNYTKVDMGSETDSPDPDAQALTSEESMVQKNEHVANSDMDQIIHDVEEAASKIISKSTIVYPRYGYTTMYTWKPCVDYSDQVVLSGGYKLAQTPDQNAAKLSLDSHGYYTNKGWMWIITNKNNTNLGVNLSVRCGPTPMGYSLNSVSQKTTDPATDPGNGWDWNDLPVLCSGSSGSYTQGTGPGFSRSADYMIVQSYGDGGRTTYDVAGAGELRLIPVKVGATVSHSVVCGAAYGQKNIWGQYTGAWSPYYAFVPSFGEHVTVPAGDTKTLTLKCSREDDPNTYYNPLGVGFMVYPGAIEYYPSGMFEPQIIGNYISGNTAYLIIKNPAQPGDWRYDYVVSVAATCPY